MAEHRDPLDAGRYVRSSVRFGGDVKRYHTWPTIQTQTVMHHTGNVLRIYWMVFGELPEKVAVYLIFHDLPEGDTGDPPHPLKAHNPVLKQEYDRIEDEALVAMVGNERAHQIVDGMTPTEKVRMKVADLLEMWEFAMTEAMLGSRHAQPIIDNVKSAIWQLPITDVDKLRIHEYIKHEILRFDYDQQA